VPSLKGAGGSDVAALRGEGLALRDGKMVRGKLPGLAARDGSDDDVFDLSDDEGKDAAKRKPRKAIIEDEDDEAVQEDKAKAAAAAAAPAGAMVDLDFEAPAEGHGNTSVGTWLPISESRWARDTASKYVRGKTSLKGRPFIRRKDADTLMVRAFKIDPIKVLDFSQLLNTFHASGFDLKTLSEHEREQQTPPEAMPGEPVRDVTKVLKTAVSKCMKWDEAESHLRYMVSAARDVRAFVA
jgi:hypothetical protein